MRSGLNQAIIVGIGCFLLIFLIDLVKNITLFTKYTNVLKDTTALPTSNNNKTATNTTFQPTSTSDRVGIAIVADAKYQALQEPLYKTVQSYAARHGYEFHILTPTSSCTSRLQQFFFQKHCTVQDFLTRQQYHDYTLFVLDGDVICAAPNVSLDRWLREDTDVLLYERDWNFEIMAGNYMIRNTPFGIYFLQTWQDYDYRARKIRGFHSYDNGAIHLAVLDVLHDVIPSQEYAECNHLYQNLTGFDVTNLTEYYAFVACTRRVLGPNRAWQPPNDGGKLTILHRYHGFAIDYYVANRKPGGGIPFYHGEKDPPEAVQHYNTTSNVWKSAEEQSMAINEGWYSAAQNNAWQQVPHINLQACMRNFSCKVASMNGEPHRNVYQQHNDTVLFEYSALFSKTTR